VLSKKGIQEPSVKQEVLKEEPMMVDQDLDVKQSLSQMEFLPPGVSNVDLYDHSDPQLCSDNVRSIYIYLRNLECAQPIKDDFLKGSSVSAKMRAVLVNWLAEVHEQFKLLQETLYLSIAVLDRYLSVEGLRVKRQKLQLIGVASMFIASKYEEMYTPEIGDFVYITDNSCSASDIRNMEINILKALNFDLGRPLGLHFLRRNSKAGDVSAEQHNFAKFALEASFTEYSLSHILPSKLAAAALLLALRVMAESPTFDCVWTANLHFYSGYDVTAVKQISSKLALLLLGLENSKFKTIYTKYMSKSRMSVAKLISTKHRGILDEISVEA